MKKIEYCCLNPIASLAYIEDYCRRTIGENLDSITLPSLFVKRAKEILGEHPISLSTAIAVPFGWSVIEAKIAEIILAMVDGADELEVMINMTALKNNDWQYLAKELNTILTVVRKQQKRINIIVESEYLNAEEITRCCDLYGAAGIDCLSLSTGFHERLPAFETVRQFRSQLADAVQLKIAGASLDHAAIDLYRAAGADRIGLLVK
ncbi:MAG: 2-deoxyribose-5-phosphate aldolase [Chitinophagaceae bacterium]|nr:MAG: 2-deoxyribose-5-phosphate aldolase [Chitinophagaceae bacterium]